MSLWFHQIDQTGLELLSHRSHNLLYLLVYNNYQGREVLSTSSFCGVTKKKAS